MTIRLNSQYSVTNKDFVTQLCTELLAQLSVSLAIDCKLETDGTRPVRPAIPALRSPELSVCHRLTDGELSEQSCAELQLSVCHRLTDGELSEQSCAELHRKEVKAKLNRDANQRIDFIWRRALRVSQTDGELSEQSCAEAIDCKLETDGTRPVRAAIASSAVPCAERKEVKVKLNGDANQRIDFFRRRALRGYRGGLYEQPPWRSSAELLHGGCSQTIGYSSVPMDIYVRSCTPVLTERNSGAHYAEKTKAHIYKPAEACCPYCG
ncbi:hypothetical protein Bbelb_188200 [Branchiostoma belcheri]|nr:hypothetical protein Bbelb_188200 [Branchiostoma belcheri]